MLNYFCKKAYRAYSRRRRAETIRRLKVAIAMLDAGNAGLARKALATWRDEFSRSAD